MVVNWGIILCCLSRSDKKTEAFARAGVVQWIECQSVKQWVTGSIPSQGTCLVCRPGPQQGVHERHHTLIFLSLSFSFPSTPSKNK